MALCSVAGGHSEASPTGPVLLLLCFHLNGSELFPLLDLLESSVPEAPLVLQISVICGPNEIG